MYQIYDLKCNGLRNPIGIVDMAPLFSWKTRGDQSSLYQVIYQITVWNREKQIVWDSGEQKSRDIFDIPYEGDPLQSHEIYTWQVKSIHNKCEECISLPQTFSIGMLEAVNWQGKWIEADYPRKPVQDCTESWKILSGMIQSSEHPETILDPSIYMRKEIEIPKTVDRAVAYATAHGIYELQIDGKAVSDLFAPEYTVYSQYLEVQQYDVTKRLEQGKHCIGILLADGWYTGKIGLMGVGEQYGNTNGVFLQIEIIYTDGSREQILSNEQFRWNTGAYEYADLFVGEKYIAGKEEDGWNLPGFCDSHWKQVILTDYGYTNFKGRSAEPIQVVRTLRPLEIITSPKGEVIINVGENIVGYLNLKGKGSKEQPIRLCHSEVLSRDGNFSMNILGQNKNQEDIYVPKEDGIFQYKPKFTFHGFQYVKVEGMPKEDILEVQVIVIATNLDKTGSFECSHEGLSQLQENIIRSQQGNMLSVPTDCPQRERAGWTGDMQAYAPTACFNMDMESFLDRWLRNMRLEQLKDGQIPNVIPDIDSNRYVSNSPSSNICSAGWGDACVIVPFRLYQTYGKKRVLQDNYSMMEKWMDYIAGKMADGSWKQEAHFGDWLVPSITKKSNGNPMESANITKEYAALAMYAYTTNLMEEICRVLGKTKKETEYREINESIRQAFSDEYIDEEGRLPVSLQGIYVLALSMNMVAKPKRNACIRQLTALIQENNNCLDTGFLSVPFLLDTLYDAGEKELAYTLLYQNKCPSWLYEVEKGATTIWESWNAILEDNTSTVTSYNHFTFGCVGEFMYRKILGIQAEEPGYGVIRIAPDISCGLEWAKGSFSCPYGCIEVQWKKEKGTITLQVILPPGTEGILIWNGAEEKIVNGLCIRQYPNFLRPTPI